MKILMINKFLYPNGGAETYVMKLGAYLCKEGHEVQYFGMRHQDNIVGNEVNAYTETIDFHGKDTLKKLTYPFKIIYSIEARRKIRMVLDSFQPEVCHLNNFNYQLTPSIILEIDKWRKKTGRKCKIIYTAHDGQLVCPNHMLRNPLTHTNCEKCVKGQFYHCTGGKCIHGSRMRSIIGSIEAYFWKWKKVYAQIDTIICCSEFMKKELDNNPLLASRTVTLHNFVENTEQKNIQKGNYVLYFGRYSEEKGIDLLLEACRQLPDIPFVFAGGGPLEHQINEVENIRNVGFQKGQVLAELISKANFSVYPSVWYENCPFSVMESQSYGTPVIGACIGGIPELIQEDVTGILFKAGNISELVQSIENLWFNKEKQLDLVRNCQKNHFDTIQQYCTKLMQIYKD